MRRGRRLAWVAAGLTGLLALRAWRRRARSIGLDGARVLITGGSRGLGLVLAREFGALGARVAVCARDGHELERAQADLSSRGIPAIAIPCDLTDRAQVEAMVHRVRAELGGVDVLVNNAGVIEVGPLDTMTLADFETAMATNFWAALYTTFAVLPMMRQGHGGRIVNITSIGGKLSVPHLLPYSASKFALVGFSEGLRVELRREGILVTTVCPGLMRTGSPRNARFKGQHRAEYAWFAISDSLPGLSMQAERAARKIIAACRAGDAYVVISVPAKLADTLHALFPGLVADVLGLANRLLPEPGGIGTFAAKGADSESALAPSALTALGDEAARRNNEMTDTSTASRGEVGPQTTPRQRGRETTKRRKPMAKEPGEQQQTDADRIAESGAGQLDAPGPRRPRPHREPSRSRRAPGTDTLRERLQRERDDAIARLQQMRRSPEVGESASARGSESTFDEGDAAQASERRDMSFSARERLARRIEQLTAALERIDRGAYGRCAECGRDIEPERLAAIPEAATCLACQERQEQGEGPQEAA